MLYAIDFDDTLNYTEKTDRVYNPNYGLISFLQDKDFVILTARMGTDSNLTFIKNFTKEMAINPIDILFSNDEPKGPILERIGASILIDDNEEQRESSRDYGVKAIHPDDLRKKIASKRTVDGLRAEPVDAEHLSDKSWYQTEDGDDTWYYWDDKKTKQSDMPLSVDPALKDLVKFLFENGIETMPSCEGHATSRKDALKIFKKLTDEEREINEEGLPLVNTEDHADKIIFKDEDYKLEINDPEELVQEDYSGYIGIRLKNKNLLNYIYEQIADIDDDAKVSIDKNILNISVNTDDEKKKESLWKELSEIIISELDVAKKKARFNRIFSLNKIAKNSKKSLPQKLAGKFSDQCKIFNISESSEEHFDDEDFDYYDILDNVERIFASSGIRISRQDRFYEACINSKGDVLGASVVSYDPNQEMPTLRFSVAVSEVARGGGIGKELTKSIVEENKNQWLIEAFVVNPNMARLLESLGFEAVGGGEWSEYEPVMQLPGSGSTEWLF